MKPTNLFTAFDSQVQAQAGEIAVFWGDKAVTYGQLAAEADRLSHHLRHVLGVRPGDRVAVWLKNRPEFIVAVFGILGADAVVVPINNFLKPDEVAFMLNDSGMDVMITERVLAEALPRLGTARPSLKSLLAEDFDGLEPVPAWGKVDTSRTQADLAVIIYTSGTTGQPKGAMLSHGNLLCNVESCRQVLTAVEEDRFVVVLPLFHSFMMCVGMFVPLLVGGSIVLVKSLHPPKSILQEIVQHQGTILACIPQVFRTLAHAPIDGLKLPLRICLSGGAPLPLEVLREFNARMPVRLLEGYGLSEASPVVSMNPLRGPWKDGSIGVPIPGVEISIQDEQGNLLPPGEVGEVCVRGGNVMMGYWNQPEATAQALRQGWLLTGDVGYGDADGYFYITDRKKDMLLVNGINVYPREIEEVIYQIPGVKEAAVIGLPDPRKGEQPVAFVSLLDGAHLDEKTICHHVRSKLADYKVPRRVVFMPGLPRNATGKILKTALRQSATSAAPDPGLHRATV